MAVCYFFVGFSHPDFCLYWWTL